MSTLTVDCVLKADGSYTADDAYVVARRRHEATKITGNIAIPPKRARRYFTDPMKRLPMWRMLKVKAITANKTDLDYEKEAGYYRGDDPLVVDTLIPMQLLLNGTARDAHKIRVLQDKYPGPFWATHIESERGYDKYAIDAYLCSGATDEEIASRFDVDANDIWWYKKMYFDVEEHLDNAAWMHMYAFLPALTTTDNSRAGMWRAVGWKHALGKEGLDAYISFARKPNVDIFGTVSWMIELEHIKQSADLLMASKYTRFERTEAFNTHISYLNSRHMRSTTGPVTEAESHLVKVMEMLPGAIIKRDRNDTRKVEAIDNSSLENLFETRSEKKKMEAREARTVG